MAALGSILSFLPIPSTLNGTHDAETLITVRLEANGGAKRERHYTAAEIATGKLFRDMAEKDPIFGKLEEIRKRFSSHS